MPVYDPIVLGVKACKCGRLSTKIHCSHCGCYDIRGMAKENTRTDPNTAEQTKHRVYRCKRCFMTFDDWEWRNECQAEYWESKQAKILREKQDELDALVEETKRRYGKKTKIKSFGEIMTESHKTESLHEQIEQPKIEEPATENKEKDISAEDLRAMIANADKQIALNKQPEQKDLNQLDITDPKYAQIQPGHILSDIEIARALDKTKTSIGIATSLALVISRTIDQRATLEGIAMQRKMKGL